MILFDETIASNVTGNSCKSKRECCWTWLNYCKIISLHSRFSFPVNNCQFFLLSSSNVAFFTYFFYSGTCNRKKMNVTHVVMSCPNHKKLFLYELSNACMFIPRENNSRFEESAFNLFIFMFYWLIWFGNDSMILLN